MSAIRDYLEAKAAGQPGEWLRREPRTTHPDIQEAVREFEAAGGTYDDDAERFVEERAGDLPAHGHHGGEDRDPLTVQLGHEVYIARRVLDDLAASEALAALQADGFVPLDESALVDGGRYVICLGTLYSGHRVPVFSRPKEVRAKRIDAGFMFLPKGARTHGFRPSHTALVKAAS